MRLVLQRVTRAAVAVDGETIAEIGHGLLVLVGIEAGDDAAQARAAAAKLAGVRLFADASGHLNRDAEAAGGDFLLVPNFTLAGGLERGRRPSFERAAAPAVARGLFDELAAALREHGFEVPTGRFGATMEVELVNDGPVTLVVDVA